MNDEIQKAVDELGHDEFNRRFRRIFGEDRLDFVDTIVINLPRSCHANCRYCIDNKIRFVRANVDMFMDSCERTLREFPNTKRISITGGSLDHNEFNRLMDMIGEYFPDAEITFNTNGIFSKAKDYDFGRMTFVNLHRFSTDEKKNADGFRSSMHVLTLDEAVDVFGDSLTLRTVVDDDFDFDEYMKTGINLYLNRLIGGNEHTERKFWELEEYLSNATKTNIEHRRRNQYETFKYNGVNIRLGIGDYNQTHKIGRKAFWVNVAIVHRSGIVSGSWFEDDKVLYRP